MVLLALALALIQDFDDKVLLSMTLSTPRPDFGDLDGDDDVLFVSGGFIVAVLENAGAATPWAITTLDGFGSNWIVSIDAGQFDGKSAPDVVALNDQVDVVLARGFGCANFAPGNVVASLSSPFSITRTSFHGGDVDGDGDLDLATIVSM